MTQTQLLNDKAFSLFHQFARMEYALKAAGFHCGDGDAKANWTAFAKSAEIDQMFATSKNADIVNAIEYLRKNPPRKQTISNGLLQWSPAPPTTNSDSDLILIYVRRIRNNLFHGGKFNGNWFQPERSEKLIDSALKILECCREASLDVNVAYSNY